MKVTLIFPSIRNFGGFSSMGKHPECVYINHGLASISAVLKQHGHQVNLIDLRECKDWDDVLVKIHLANADVYGVYMQTLDYYEASRCARIIRKMGRISVAGGPHPSIRPNDVLYKTPFDYVFIGEAEKTFPEFLEDMDSFNRFIIGEHPNLDRLPYEDREIFNMKKVLATKHNFYPSPFLSVMSGRGCPYNCSFCAPAEHMIFGKFRMRNLHHFMGEITYLANHYRYAMLMIDDDSFTIKPDYVQQFCELYQYIKRPFTCQTRVDFVVRHPNLVKRMKEVGLWMFVIGFESGNQRILNLLRKGTTVEQNYEAAEICHKLGVKMWANFMYGMPTETKEEAMDTLNMVRKIKPYHHSPSFYTPIVGTDLYDYCKKEGLLLSEDPVHLGSRSPKEPKIKGPDYPWLRKQLERMRVESLSFLPLKDRVKKVAKWTLRKVRL